MDLLVLHGIVQELKTEIQGAQVGKIFQMSRTDLLFRLRTPRGEKRLILSTHPDFHRLHLTEKKYANPLVPPRFCTYLRKHVTGARIAEVSQVPYERIVRFHLIRRMDAGVSRTLFLLAELVGRGSNILLLDDQERILDCLHFRREENGAARPASPGLPYVPLPASERQIPEELSPEQREHIAALPPGEKWKGLVEKFPGIPSALAREIEFRGRGIEPDLSTALQEFSEAYRQGAFAPRVITRLDGKKILAPISLQSLGDAAEETFPTMNQAADTFYFEQVLRHSLQKQKAALARRFRQLLTRLNRRRENLLHDREKFAGDLKLKEMGEILVAHFPRIKKGMREIELPDYRHGGTILIPLEERLDAAGNVQRYFHRYKKAKRGLEITAERMEAAEREIEYLESVSFQAEEAADGEELSLIRAELEKERILPPPRESGKAKEKEEPAVPYRRFRSSEGLEIFCGKHNVGNDYLVRHVARGNDLWFHAQGFPGSHVLLRTRSGEADFQSIQEAAAIAAWFSQGKNSTRVPVDYTEVKNLRKPKGARPGMVTYSHQKTISVRAEKEVIDRLAAG